MSRDYLLYLAGPIAGQSYDGCTSWRDWVAARLDPRVVPLSPMRGKSYLSDSPWVPTCRIEHPLSTDRAIVARDRMDVRRADLVLLNLLPALGGPVSIGSMVELGWADAAGVPVLLVAPAPCHLGKPYDHPFVRALASFQAETLEQAIPLVHHILLPAWEGKPDASSPAA